MKSVVPKTWVPGTPRGYGSRKTEDEWLAELSQGLSGFRGMADESSLPEIRYEVDLDFVIWPLSPKYGGQNLPHGTDLDNLVKMTIDGLALTEGRGLGIIWDDSAIYRVNATKSHTEDEQSTGVWITIRGI